MVINVQDRRPLLSVTAADCEWAYTRGTGAGGQKRNKTSSATHCMHRPSEAHGYAEDHREQRRNRELAFARMCADKRFVAWREAEVRRRSGEQARIEGHVARLMHPFNLNVEMKKDGKWVSYEDVE